MKIISKIWCKQYNDDYDENDELGKTQNFLLGFIPTSSGSRLELNYGRLLRALAVQVLQPPKLQKKPSDDKPIEVISCHITSRYLCPFK